MKTSNVMAVILSALVLFSLSSCQDFGIKEHRSPFWYYYIETEDGTDCEVKCFSGFKHTGNGFSGGGFGSIDIGNEDKPYGILTITYKEYTKDELSEFDITIQRTSGNGKCTVYFVTEYLPYEDIDEKFAVWIKENYKQRFIIEDDEIHHEKLKL